MNAGRKDAQAWQSWGVVETRAGNYKIAKTLFECGIRNDPSHDALWQAYGMYAATFVYIILDIMCVCVCVYLCESSVPF